MNTNRTTLIAAALAVLAFSGSACATAANLQPSVAVVAKEQQRWGKFQPYLDALSSAVHLEWDGLLDQSKQYPPSGTEVRVTFLLDSAGKVQRIIQVGGTAGTWGTQVAVAALTNRAPYGDWTDEMKRVLGEQQALTFTFYYR